MEISIQVAVGIRKPIVFSIATSDISPQNILKNQIAAIQLVFLLLLNDKQEL